MSGELIFFVFAQLSPTSTLPALADKLYKAALDRTARYSVYSVYYSVYLLYKYNSAYTDAQPDRQTGLARVG